MKKGRGEGIMVCFDLPTSLLLCLITTIELSRDGFWLVFGSDIPARTRMLGEQLCDEPEARFKAT